MLLESYTNCKKILTEACKELPLLQEFTGNFEKRIDQLKQREYFLFFTGTTNIRYLTLSVKLSYCVDG